MLSIYSASQPRLLLTISLAACVALSSSTRAEPTKKNASAVAPGARLNSRTTTATAANEAAVAVPVAGGLPPLPSGVEELRFADFFKLPVGPEGLEVTPKLRALDGKRVRVLGYMVREDLTPCNSCPIIQTKGRRPAPAWMSLTVAGRMMLTAAPASVSHAHYGLADDLPPQTVFVTVPDKFGELVPYTSGPMLLTGVLSVGSKIEPDARASLVRLTLDPPQPIAATTFPVGHPKSTNP